MVKSVEAQVVYQQVGCGWRGVPTKTGTSECVCVCVRERECVCLHTVPVVAQDVLKTV